MRKDGNNANDGKHSTHDFQSSRSEGRLLPPRGDYQTLHSFHKAEVIYDITFRFTHKYLAKGDRTIDQMIQAARSGKKNLLEGSLIDQQLRRLEKDFLDQGGLRERMTRARLAHRTRLHGKNRNAGSPEIPRNPAGHQPHSSPDSL